MSVHSIGFPEDDISALRAQKYSSGIADQPLLAPNSTEVGVEFEASAEVVAADIKPQGWLAGLPFDSPQWR